MDSYQASDYSAPTANPADLTSSNPYPVPTMSQTTLWGPPDTYLTMPVDTEDPPRTSHLLQSTNHPYGINEETGEPFEYPAPPSPPPAFGARPVPASVLAAAAPRLSPAPSRQSTRSSRPTTRQASTPARPATNDRVYKTTDRHRNVSQQAHAQYRDKEVEAARALHGMVPGDFQSDEAIKPGGTKEKMRAMEDAMSYIAALEEENRELRRQLGV